MALLGLPFTIEAPPFEERVRPGVPAAEQALECAIGKSRSVAVLHPEALVVGSDTLIAVDDRVFGKPQVVAEARAMLSDLRGRPHRIHTAVALCCVAAQAERSVLVTVNVWMKAWTDADLDAYLATGESLGKAGGYAIQGGGAELIARIEGDYTAAVGLPLRATADLLKTMGRKVPVDVDDLYRRRPHENWARVVAGSP